ncbi:Zn-dependent protease (includes SpoIVFB) [Methylomagnum ishizawai]|uniref:Zn-dependent protease (Includes SpoIVFB) n=1 Tax=Methylomagnum ishizawai TaxID=1760988 RepID=A0A1Y6CXW8_9GAMM|nr:site-2 protease family protein [Methylomagnum ishizawai]SMF95518.1 Zn-dependent protease (includes SpoIVFB) [Methylomagnum ishizawai]
MEQLTTVGRFAVWALPVIFAITLHEVAHGWVAKLLGDKTADRLGRLTLNPLKHIDPVGTVILPGVMLVLGGFIFGWAKPVPVDWGKLHQPKRDIGLVALAGPLANLLMVASWILIAKLAHVIGDRYYSLPMIYMAAAGIYINLMLMLINLVPLPPLDGGRIMTSLLPDKWAYRYGQLEQYGLLILLILIATPALSLLLGGPMNLLLNQSLLYAGIPYGILYQLMGPGG